MAVSSNGSIKHFTALSTDVKPTDSHIGVGSTLTESDTGIEYFYDGDSWQVRSEIVGTQKDLILQRISTTGNGGGVEDLAVDGSITPQDFYIMPPAGKVYRIARWMLYMVDQKGFDVTNFGALGAPLTNGLEIWIERDGVRNNILDFPITENGEIYSIAYDAKLETFGNTDDMLVARWTLTRAGQYVRLNGATSDKLGVTVNDDLSALTHLYINCQGYIE